MNTELQDRLAGRRVVASISGGKDSGALSLWLAEQGIEHDRVHLLTGWDSEITMEYIRGPLAIAVGPIVEISGPLLMEDLIRKKGMFPSRIRRFCTTELKVKPMQRYLTKRIDDGEELINAVGIRAAESESRSTMPEWEWQDGFDCEVWRPLIRWSEADVIDIHRRHGLAPNPLYLMGASRVGCWPCIHARKSEIRLIADKDPARIVRLKMLEDQVAVAAEARAIRDGREFTKPAFFQNPSTRTTENPGLCWPIEKVVEWSRTVRGGVAEDKQENLFANMNDGCMRWGLCDTSGGTK